MASLDDIERALRAADAAGNADDARALARAYTQMKGAAQQPATQPTPSSGNRQPRDLFADPPRRAPRDLLLDAVRTKGPWEKDPLVQSGGVLRNLRAGATEAITGALDMLSDPGAGEEMRALGLDRKAVPALGPGERQHAVHQALGAYNPEAVSATSLTDRLARAAGYGATSFVAPEMMYLRGPALAAKVLQLGRAGLTGATSGVGSEMAQEVAPDSWKPVAGLAGGLAGGVGGSLATQVPAAVKAGGRLVERVLGPMTEGGAQRLAARRIATSATSPDQLDSSLRNVRQIVPGSQPTTFQATGDMGLGSLEREMQTKFPAEFQQRRADQNAARIGQLDRLQPGGDPGDLPSYIRGQMRWLDEQTERDVADATRVAQQRTEGLGGNQSPEHYGSSLRIAAQEAADTSRARERSLWRAIDPSGDLTVNAAPIRTAAHEIADSLSGSAKPPAGDERVILDIARGYAQSVPFRDIGDLRSWVSDAMRQPSILRRLLVETGSAAAGLFATGTMGGTAIGWLGAKTVGALRDAGFKRADDILREAMLDPVLARALLTKAPPKPDTGNAQVLMAVLRRHALMGAAVGTSDSERRAIGG